MNDRGFKVAEALRGYDQSASWDSRKTILKQHSNSVDIVPLVCF